LLQELYRRWNNCPQIEAYEALRKIGVETVSEFLRSFSRFSEEEVSVGLLDVWLSTLEQQAKVERFG